MRKLPLLLVVVVILAGAGGFLALGLFPPSPHPQQVVMVVPNSRFAALAQ
jgi:hypothetical protein